MYTLGIAKRMVNFPKKDTFSGKGARVGKRTMFTENDVFLIQQSEFHVIISVISMDLQEDVLKILNTYQVTRYYNIKVNQTKMKITGHVLRDVHF